MPKLVIPDGYAHVLFNLSLAGDDRPYCITWGAAVGAEGDLQEMVEEISDVTLDKFTPHYDAGFTLGPTSMRVSVDGADHIYVAPETRAGTALAESYLPQNCAILVHKRTTQAGRRGRGRLYLPGAVETEVSETGHLSAQYLADFQTDMNAWLTALNTDPMETVGMWLLHSTSPGFPDETLAQYQPDEVTLLQVDPVIATQRRRLRR